MNQVPLLLMELDPTHYNPKLQKCTCPAFGESGFGAENKETCYGECHFPFDAVQWKCEDPYDFYEDSLGG